MQTSFTDAQLLDPSIAEVNSILRKCVHCGFCNSTCPTFNLLGDELDGPRGRIYLIKDLLENDKQPSDTVVQHLDRCLSCLSCMSTCPSGVDYMHLIDVGRTHIESRYKRSTTDSLIRALFAYVLPRPKLMKVLLLFAPLLNLFKFILPKSLQQAEKLMVKPIVCRSDDNDGLIEEIKDEVGLLVGCVQSVMGQDINQSTKDVLQRHNVKVHEFNGCCGAIEQHLGKTTTAHTRIKNNLADWQYKNISALLVNASGCGTQLKDYGHLMRHNKDNYLQAEQLSDKTMDISEYLLSQSLNFQVDVSEIRVAYHSPCSMQHGQKIHTQPIELLKQAGFPVKVVPETHLCCGSAGTYNLLQPELSQQLTQRKAKLINALDVDVVATGNLGCILQLQSYIDIPIVHSVSLLNWATGGVKPAQL